MKKRTPLVPVIAVVLITLSNLFVFSEIIESKPNHAGFWMILVFGMSLGVAIVAVRQHFSKKE